MHSAPTRRAGLTAPPPLENGDHLTAKEFPRRYDAMPEVKKAELINGIVYMGSPVRITHHGEPENLIQTWLGTYQAGTPGTCAAANTTVRFGPRNVPQPDALLMIRREHGGNAKIGRDGPVHGAPDFVVEVAGSSASIDLHAKLEAYRSAGVREYLVWCAPEKSLKWFSLEDGAFHELSAGPDGVISSKIMPGLVLDTTALLNLDSASLLRRLSRSLNKGAHKLFVRQLVEARPHGK